MESKSQTFGVPLDSILDREKRSIPSLVINSIHYLISNGFSQFTADDVDNSLVERINGGEEVDFGKIGDCKTVCSLLVKFLSSLPEPVIVLYEPFIKAEEIGEEDQNVNVQKLKEAVEALPQANACLLDYVIYFIVWMAENNQNETNIMTVARVLAPILFRYPGGLDWTLRDLEIVTRIVLDLVIYYHETFQNICYNEKKCPKETTSQNSRLSLFKNTVYLDSKIKKQSHPINILSLDGGGMRGLVLVTVLTKLAIKMFGNADEDGTEKLMSCFDLVCGTSTGGIISVGLCMGYSLIKTRELYLRMGSNVFAFGYLWAPGRWARYYMNGDYYSSKLLKGLFEKEFGDNSMSSIKHKVFVTTTDATYSKWKPVLISSYDVPKGQSNILTGLPIPNALRATSAAPTYFSPVKIGNKCYVDGGMIANNPTELAIFEAHRLWKDRYIQCIVSIGTGVPTQTPGSQNVLRLVNEIVNIATDSEMTNTRVKEWLKFVHPKPDYFRLSPPGIGSINLDASSKTILLEMEKATNLYMEQPEQQQEISRIAEILSKSRNSI